VNWQVVQLKDVKPSPWRNGGGETRELVAWPDATDWLWRLSVAEVVRSGPFSRFDDVERWFAVLSGAGVCLTVSDLQAPSRDSRHHLTPHSAPFCFDGAAPVDCALLDGVTQDFNLMVRRDPASAQMVRVAGTYHHQSDAPETIAVYAIETGASVLFDNILLEIPAHSLAWRSVPAGASVQVQTANSLWMVVRV